MAGCAAGQALTAAVLLTLHDIVSQSSDWPARHRTTVFPDDVHGRITRILEIALAHREQLGAHRACPLLDELLQRRLPVDLGDEDDPHNIAAAAAAAATSARPSVLAAQLQDVFSARTR